MPSTAPRKSHGQPTNAQAARILENYVFSEISKCDALMQLAAMSIQGGFRDDDSFCGYDYNAQAWIDTQAASDNAQPSWYRR